jgi:hypothetical protein
VLFLIADLCLKGKTQNFYKRAVETALERLEHISPGRYTRSGWMDPLFAAMEREVERRSHGGPQDIRDWWASIGRAAMQAHVERVRAEAKADRAGAGSPHLVDGRETCAVTTIAVFAIPDGGHESY